MCSFTARRNGSTWRSAAMVREKRSKAQGPTIRRCKTLCEFCFVLQMAPRMRRTLYIKDDDYRYSFLFGHFVTLTNLSDHDWERIEQQHLSPLYVSVHSTDLENR